jgi:hypothetical protein
MYHFAVVALLGLALFKLVDLLEDLVPGLTRFHTLVTFVLAVAATVAADYSLFQGFHIQLRESWMGTWGTGLIVGGTTSAWRAAFHWLGSSEGEEPEKRHPQHGRPRMAA